MTLSRFDSEMVRSPTWTSVRSDTGPSAAPLRVRCRRGPRHALLRGRLGLGLLGRSLLLGGGRLLLRRLTAAQRLGADRGEALLERGHEVRGLGRLGCLGLGLDDLLAFRLALDQRQKLFAVLVL